MNTKSYILKRDRYLEPESPQSELFAAVLELVTKYGAVAIVDTLMFIGDLNEEAVLV
jgi:hypothetical protein